MSGAVFLETRSSKEHAMEVINLTTDIEGDGHLHLDIPTKLPPGTVEVVVVMQYAGGKGDVTAAGYDFSDLTGHLLWQGDAIATQRSLRDAWS